MPGRTVCIDASAMIDLLLRTPRAAAVTQVLRGMDMVIVPDLINVEVLRTIRAKERSGAIADLVDSPLQRLPTWRVRPRPTWVPSQGGRGTRS